MKVLTWKDLYIVSREEKKIKLKKLDLDKFLDFRHLETLHSSSFSTVSNFFYNQSMAFAGLRKWYLMTTCKQTKISSFFKASYWINECQCYDDMVCFFFYVSFLLFVSFNVLAITIELKRDASASNGPTLKKISVKMENLFIAALFFHSR